MIDPDQLDWTKMHGLIPAVVQSRCDGAVLMLGYLNREALDRTLETQLVTFFSRSKQRLWTKGECSGNRLHLVDARIDCDGDALLLIVDADGPTCHLGRRSCFGDVDLQRNALEALEERLTERASADPAESYTARLMAEGVKRIAQKVGEEAVETALAAATGDRIELQSEAADLIYHLTVLLLASKLNWSDVLSELASRQGRSTAEA